MRPAACLLVALLLPACAMAPRVPPGADWPRHREALQAMSEWRLTGRVAVAVDGEGASAGLEWRESGGISELQLSGPFGAGAFRVTLGPQGLRLEDGRGASAEGPHAEQLLAERFGTSLPLAALRYWVLGAPAPALPFTETGGADGGPSAFEQAGWQVSVQRWEPAAGGALLPARLTAEQGAQRIKLAISRWDLPP